MVDKMLNSKGGWIRVVEAFFAILLIGAVIILAINSNAGNSEDIASKVYENELSILRAVQLNESLRASILNLNDNNLPLDLNDSLFPQDVRAKIEEKIPTYLMCGARICKINYECVPDYSSSSNIYTSQVTIFANLQINNPRKLAISCGLK